MRLLQVAELSFTCMKRVCIKRLTSLDLVGFIAEGLTLSMALLHMSAITVSNEGMRKLLHLTVHFYH